MKIIVLAGGLSDERDVSFSSGSLIANALLENNHEVMLMDLFLGDKHPEFPLIYHTKEENFKYEYKVPEEEPNLDSIKSMNKSDHLVCDNLIDICKNADYVILALHGSIGENGELQSLLDIYNIPYSGSSALGCMISMNKDIAKRLMLKDNILTADWELVDFNKKIEYKYPCVVKPCSNGSSVGISIVHSQSELDHAIDLAKKYEDEIMIEKLIEGREFTVGILDNKALPVIEIVPKKGFYDYKNKYQSGLTEEICPANIDDNITKNMQDIALKVHKLLHLGKYSRIDLMMDQDNNIYCLEANTLPGMTPTSLLPLAAKTSGISYNELCELLIDL